MATFSKNWWSFRLRANKENFLVKNLFIIGGNRLNEIYPFQTIIDLNKRFKYKLFIYTENTYFVMKFIKLIKEFKENDLIFLLPFYELFLIFIQMIIFIKNLTSKPKHW